MNNQTFLNNSYVSDENKLRKFLELILEIKEMLIEKSDNSIENMFHMLSWNDTVYRTFNEGLRLMWEKKKENQLPGTLVEYIHKAHLSFMLSILRKLYEPAKLNNKKVNSIPNIIKMIKNNSYLFNRENYVCYDGTPYSENSGLDWKVNNKIKNRHNIFDKLPRVNNEKTRKRDDIIDNKILCSIEKNAVFNKNIKKYTNKFLFHASAKNNRPNSTETYKLMKLVTIQNQIRNAIWSVLQIGKMVDQLVSTELAAAKFDHLKGWDSLFDQNIKSRLNKYWHHRAKWWKKWTNYYWDYDYIFISVKRKI